MDEKLLGIILIYGVSYKPLVGAKLFSIMFDKADGFILDYNGTKDSVLFGPGKYGGIYNRIRYLISLNIQSKTYNYFLYKLILKELYHQLCIIMYSSLRRCFIKKKITITKMSS